MDPAHWAQFRAFNVVRHGYDRGEVDRYLNSLAHGAASAEPQPSRMRGRGYDRAQVDARIRNLLKAAGAGQ